MDENSMPTNLPVAEPGSVPPAEATATDILAEVAKKISEAHNVLIALSGNPSVDEMAAAIGLTLFLDRLDKRATAIYSGATPNALEFLKPEETFEPSADALQDFVIALNKEKADHIRYKLDGDYVKIYITPYKTRIDEKNLEFSYGDYNVDLVLALDVANGVDLDSALREHGRIMHDAVIVNITTGNPGKFGEIEWSDKNASSVSEMIARLLYSARSSKKIEKDDATAFLTGIVAATNRFSNAKTTPVTMQIASRLMESGANQQLISKNITPDVENELYAVSKVTRAGDVNNDPTKLEIVHDNSADVAAGEMTGADIGASANDNNVGNVSSTVSAIGANGENVVMPSDNTISEAGVMPSAALIDDLKAAEASLAQAGSEAVPEAVAQPVRIEGATESTTELESELNGNPNVVNESMESVTYSEPQATGQAIENTAPMYTQAPNEAVNSGVPNEIVGSAMPSEPGLPPVVMPDMVTGDSAVSNSMPETGALPSVNEPQGEGIIDSGAPEKVIQPPAGSEMASTDIDTERYGKMLKEAIGDTGEMPAAGVNPAAMMAPQVDSAPEVNGAPDMNYMPLPGQEILPPPPTPPIDLNMSAGGMQPVVVESMNVPMEQTTPIVSGSENSSGISNNVPEAPAEPPVSQPAPLGQQPAMQDQVYRPQAADPGAFRIPGMP